MSIQLQKLSLKSKPLMKADNQIPMLLKNNINILDQYSYKDIRETKGGGMNQSLLVQDSKKPVDDIVSVLQKITPTLPDT